MTFDEVRAAFPELAISAYALTPAGDVTLEILAPDGGVFTFVGETLEAALDLAFPDESPEQPAASPEPSAFD